MKHILLLFPIVIAVACAPADEIVEEFVVDEPDRPRVGDMILIPAGEFIMGSDEKPPLGPPLAAPERVVDLPAFRIDAYEVTNAQYIEFVQDSDYETEGDWRTFYTIGREDYPVANLTWNDARAYAEWAGKRLPTEAEWEKAARGPDGNQFPWGDEWVSGHANTTEAGVRNVTAVGRYEQDRSYYGVYDMFGNVQEWTAEELRPYPGSPVSNDPAFRHGSIAVRGSSYAYKGSTMRLWSRSAYPEKMQAGLGFRCVEDVSEEEVQAAAYWNSPVRLATTLFRRVLHGLEAERPVALTSLR